MSLVPWAISKAQEAGHTVDNYNNLYPPQNPMGQFLNDPGMAMAGTAINNMMQMRRGLPPTQNPFVVLQEQQRRNAILQNQRYEQIEQKRVRDLQIQKAQLGIEKAEQDLDPLYTYEEFKRRYPDQAAELSYPDFLRLGMKGTEAPSAVREYQFYNSLDSNAKNAYLDLKRSGTTYGLPSGGTAHRSASGGTEVLVSPEEAIKGDVALTTAVEGAKADVKSEADAEALAKKNSAAWDVYQAAIKPYSEALDGTVTGPFMGMLPAITSGQQTAEGAAAAIAPVMKQLFRQAGEGNFTDSDQRILMDMLPKRGDKPETIEFKFKMIDDIVRAKLGIKYVSEDGTIREK